MAEYVNVRFSKEAHRRIKGVAHYAGMTMAGLIEDMARSLECRAGQIMKQHNIKGWFFAPEIAALLLQHDVGKLTTTEFTRKVKDVAHESQRPRK